MLSRGAGIKWRELNYSIGSAEAGHDGKKQGKVFGLIAAGNKSRAESGRGTVAE